MHIFSDPFIFVCPCSERRHYCKRRQCQSCCHFLLNFSYIGFEHVHLPPAEALERFRTVFDAALTKLEEQYGLPEKFSASLIFVSDFDVEHESFAAKTFNVSRQTVVDELSEEVCDRPAGIDWRHLLYEGTCGFIVMVRQGQFAKRCRSVIHMNRHLARWTAQRDQMLDLRELVINVGLLKSLQIARGIITPTSPLVIEHRGFTIFFADLKDKKRYVPIGDGTVGGGGVFGSD